MTLNRENKSKRLVNGNNTAKKNKEQMEKLNLWQLQLETLSTIPKKVLTDYSDELVFFKMHAVSKHKIVYMGKHEDLSKHIDNHFLTPLTNKKN